MATVEGEGTAKKKEKELLVVQDQDCFTHTTGDEYDGWFEVKKKDKIARMHGPGVYTTAEGDSYQGTWDQDKLGANQEVAVTFSDGYRYQGSLKDWCYTGKGKYFYPDGSTLQSAFEENCPTGQLTLTDPNGHTWLAKADHGFCWYRPVNHFYTMLDQTLDMTKAKKRRSKRPEVK